MRKSLFLVSLKRAIGLAFVLMLCGVAFVGLSLLRRQPARAGTSPGPASPLMTTPDGSLYAVSLRIAKFERRLMEEEKRSERLQTDLAEVRKDRDALAGQVEMLQGEVRRLRRQLAESQRPPAPTPAPANVPANVPSVVPPVTPAPVPTPGE